MPRLRPCMSVCGCSGHAGLAWCHVRAFAISRDDVLWPARLVASLLIVLSAPHRGAPGGRAVLKLPAKGLLLHSHMVLLPGWVCVRVKATQGVSGAHVSQHTPS